MRALYQRAGEWQETGSLFEAFCLEQKLRQKRQNSYKIAFVGAGGKTSAIYRLAAEAVKRGRKVLILTSTHMICPKRFGIFSEKIEEVEKVLNKESLVIVGKKLSEEKMSFVGEKFYEEVVKLAELVLIEADGSKHYPLKVPASHEPVIPSNIDEIFCLCGLSCLGEKAQQVCFRLEEARRIREEHSLKVQLGLDKELDWRIEKEDIKMLMREGYLSPLRRQERKAGVSLVLTQTDEINLEETAKKIFLELEEEGVIIGRLPLVSQYEELRL